MTNLTDALDSSSYRLQTLDEVILLRADRANGGNWLDTGLGEKPCLLLAIIALSERPVSRDRMCELLWEGGESSKARNSLRQSLFRIRRILGHDAITDNGDGLGLPGGLLTLDISVSKQLPRGPVAEMAELASRFARTRGALGGEFAAWRAAMQRAIWAVQPPTNGFVRSTLRGNGRAAGVPKAASNGADPNAPLVAAIMDEWRRAALGYPQAVWLPVGDPARAEGIRDQVARRIGTNGARVAHLAGHPGRYVPFALERDLAAALWAMPGAAGIAPEHRDAIAALATEQRAKSEDVRSALRDLMDAVVEEMPLAITIANPGSYSRQAVANLVGTVQELNGRALLVAIFDTEGGPPIASPVRVA